jgi:Ni,Fe-hydrogenase III large subunit
MLKIKQFQNLEQVKNATKLLKNDEYYFLWEFLREVDSKNDELIIVLVLDWKNIILTCIHSNQEKLPKISDIYYAAQLFENEIYDFYWKPTIWANNHILRLHNHKKNYFPKRILGKSIIKEKQEYIFTKTKFDWEVKVQVWPIHAWIIPPAHFRFTVDWDDTLNLDIQNWWVHRWVEHYFSKEKDLNKLLLTSAEIAWDSKLATSWSFAKIIEKSSNIEISESTELNRVIALELERIYNHLWTIWAIINDVWQWYILNWFLEIREEFLKLNEKVFSERLLWWIINYWKNNINLTEKTAKKILKTINKIKWRYENLLKISISSTWIYDRLSTTGIVHTKTAIDHSALWIWAKASWLRQDYRKYDTNYKDLSFNCILWENWDCFDRFNVRAEEIKQSFKLIEEAISKLEKLDFKNDEKEIQINLSDWYFIWRTEWHRWENLQLVYIENSEIKYYKFKDPSFVNWTLLEYAVLNNIIADFPVCNKSFDMSYSWFDV